MISPLLLLLCVNYSISQRIRFPTPSVRVRDCGTYARCVPTSVCETETNELRSCRTRGRYVCCPTRNPPRVAPPPSPRVAPLPRRVSPSSQTPTNVEKTKNAPECGTSASSRVNLEPAVMGGKPVSEGSFPWMAAVMKKEFGSWDVDCTAFMIDRRHALSAAHCFSNSRMSIDPKRFSLRIGHLNWRNGANYKITRISIPPEYRHNRFYDDIAVLTLEKDVADPNFIPVCLPTGDIGKDLSDMGTTVVGWGKLANGEKERMSDTLNMLSSIPVIANEECNDLLRPMKGFSRTFARGITNRFICAGFLEGGKDSCSGDSGGPLMIRQEGIWYAVGVVSFGIGCGEVQTPAGYTKISAYRDFISANI